MNKPLVHHIAGSTAHFRAEDFRIATDTGGPLTCETCEQETAQTFTALRDYGTARANCLACLFLSPDVRLTACDCLAFTIPSAGGPYPLIAFRSEVDQFLGVGDPAASAVLDEYNLAERLSEAMASGRDDSDLQAFDVDEYNATEDYLSAYRPTANDSIFRRRPGETDDQWSTRRVVTMYAEPPSEERAAELAAEAAWTGGEGDDEPAEVTHAMAYGTGLTVCGRSADGLEHTLVSEWRATCPECITRGPGNPRTAEELADAALHAAAGSIQDALGQDDGGLAGMFFASPDGETVLEIFGRYVEAERASAYAAEVDLDPYGRDTYGPGPCSMCGETGPIVEIVYPFMPEGWAAGASPAERDEASAELCGPCGDFYRELTSLPPTPAESRAVEDGARPGRCDRCGGLSYVATLTDFENGLPVNLCPDCRAMYEAEDPRAAAERIALEAGRAGRGYFRWNGHPYIHSLAFETDAGDESVHITLTGGRLIVLAYDAIGVYESAEAFADSADSLCTCGLMVDEDDEDRGPGLSACADCQRANGPQAVPCNH